MYAQLASVSTVTTSFNIFDDNNLRGLDPQSVLSLNGHRHPIYHPGYSIRHHDLMYNVIIIIIDRSTNDVVSLPLSSCCSAVM